MSIESVLRRFFAVSSSWSLATLRMRTSSSLARNLKAWETKATSISCSMHGRPRPPSFCAQYRKVEAVRLGSRSSFFAKSRTHRSISRAHFLSGRRVTGNEATVGSGRYVSFSEYRFSMKSRLNLLPVKTVQQRFQPTLLDTRCRKCYQCPEMLSHVLNHCHRHLGLIRQRHGHILARLTKAVPNHLGSKFVEQEVPGDPQHNRPDLVITNSEQKTAYIVDVTIPFEGKDSMTNSRERKVQKYAELRRCTIEEKGLKKCTWTPSLSVVWAVGPG